MHLADEVLDHLLGDLEIRDDTIAHRSDRLDIAGRAAQHHLGLITDGQNLVLAPLVDDRHDGRLVEHDAPPLHIDQRISGPEVDGHIGREHPQQASKHSSSQSFVLGPAGWRTWMESVTAVPFCAPPLTLLHALYGATMASGAVFRRLVCRRFSALT